MSRKEQTSLPDIFWSKFKEIGWQILSLARTAFIKKSKQ